MNMPVEVRCQFCAETHKAAIELPEGFVVSEYETAYAKGFCPKHAKAKLFLDAQCPGCVVSFPDCGLGRSKGISMHSHEASKIIAGLCPHRVNGTMGFLRGFPGPRVESIDLSDRAPEGSGEAIIAALTDRANLEEECRVKNESRNTNL